MSQLRYSQLKNNRTDLRQAIPLKKPFTVLFEPDNICNFRCSCCFFSNPDIYKYLPKGYMKMADFRKIADDLAAWEGEKLKVIRIIGFGEPLLNPSTPEMVKYLKELDVADRIEITTNGSLLTPEISSRLIDSGLDYIRISIYAVDPERHREITRNPIPVDKIRQNISGLRKLRDERRQGKPFIYVKMLDSFNPVENQLFLSQYEEIADETALEKPHSWLEDQDGEAKSRMVCPQPFKMLSIRYNGDVIVCDPDWQNKTRVGNALLEPVSEIWAGREMYDFWKMQLEGRRFENESCRNCSFLNENYVLDDLDGLFPDILNSRTEYTK